jgi:Flp pilus assembly protein TadD
MRGNKRIGFWLFLPVLALLLVACSNNPTATLAPTPTNVIAPEAELAPATATPVVFNSANTLPPAPTAPAITPNSTDREKIADEYMATGEFAKAEQLYQDLSKQDPQNNLLLLKLAVAQLRQNKTDEAIVLLQGIIKADPNNVQAILFLASVYADQGHVDQAIPYYEQAAKIQPQDPNTKYYLAEAYFETKQFDKAELAYKDVIKLAPNEAVLHGQLGLVLFKLEKFDEAEAEYKQAIKLDPQNPPTYNNLAYLYVELGRFDEARDPIDKAVKLGMSGDANFEATKLGLLIPDGQKEEAAGNLDKAAELYTKAAKAENSLGYYYLGKLEQGRKKIEAAAAAFKSYLAEGHMADLKKDADARLKQMGKA